MLLVYTTLYIFAPVNRLSKLTQEKFDFKHMKLVNGMVKRVKFYLKLGIIQRKLDSRKLRMVTFSDTSFANNVDSYTQLGYLNNLKYRTNLANIIHYSGTGSIYYSN